MSLSKIVEFARSKLGCGYVYGATGWICSLARRQQQAAQYPQYASTILGTCAKWDGKQCYDCAQLTRYAAFAAGASLPSGATSQWNSSAWASKGELVSMPDKAGIFLYRKSGTVMQHTGIYIGNGRVIDSRGSSYGVIESALSSYPWTHWAEPLISDAQNDETQEGENTMIRKATVTKITGATGNTVNLRRSANGAVLTTVPFGTTVSIEAESDSWSKLTYNGVTGWMMSKYLITVEDEDEEEKPDTDADIPEGMLLVSKADLKAIHTAIGKLLEE